MRGYGLQKNSPIRLSLNRENYEGLIERHGQWVRWLRASKCTCVTQNGRPDLHCTKCGGDGWVYGFQNRATETLTLPYLDGAVVELPYTDATVVGIYDYMGLSYNESARFGRFCRITGPRVPNIGENLQVIVDRALLKTASEVELTYQGSGCFEAAGLKVVGYRGVAAERSAPADIVAIGSLFNVTQNVSYAPSEYRRNLVFSVEEPAAGDHVVARDVAYIEPFLFAVVGQQHKEPDWKFLESVGGEASMTFPAWAGVGEGDIITILADSQVGKQVIDRLPGAFDTIPAFYVDSIEYIEAGSMKYYPGVHFDLWGANKIRWRSIVAPGVFPAEKSVMFVLYRYYPTYRVIREFPNVRSSENQNLPRRVALKLLSTFAERKSI